MSEKRHESESRILAEAAKDPAFRALLLASPHEAVAKLMGTPIPEGLELKVVEETPTSFYLVLPALPKAADELAAEQLEGVAGGAACPYSCGYTCWTTSNRLTI